MATKEKVDYDQDEEFAGYERAFVQNLQRMEPEEARKKLRMLVGESAVYGAQGLLQWLQPAEWRANVPLNKKAAKFCRDQAMYDMGAYIEQIFPTPNQPKNAD